MQPKLDGRARTAGGGDFPIRDDSFVGQKPGKIAGDGKMGRESTPREQSDVSQDRWRSADRRDPAPGCVMAADSICHPGIGAEMGDAGSAGQEKQVEQAGRNILEGDVTVHHHTAAARGMAVVGKRGQGDFDSGPTHQVDRGQGLDLFKSIGEQYECGRHGVIECSRARQAMANLELPAGAVGVRLVVVKLAGRTVVIFGCGYVGTALATAALRAGATVTALTRNPDRAAGLRAAGLQTVIVGDLASPDWHAEIPGADHVVNCVSSGGGGAAGYRHSYVAGMHSIGAWLEKCGGARGVFVYTGSTSVYPADDGGWIDENAAIGGEEETTAALLEAERIVRGFSAGLVPRRFLFRLAGIYGPGRHSLLTALRSGTGNLSGANHYLNLIHRDDAAAAVLAALLADVPAGSCEVLNISDGAPAARQEVVAWLAQRIGCRVPDQVGPPRSGRRGRPGLNRKIASTRARDLLGWQPRHADYRSGYESILRAE